MTRPTDVATFSSTKHEETVAAMRSRREAVHDKGEEVYRRTGKMDPLVSVKGGQIRKSRFVWAENPDGTFTLKDLKRHKMFATDGTGSFASYIAAAFEAAPRINAILEGNRNGYLMDFSFSVVQDRDDPHDVVQVPQFESDNKFAEHMRLLVPDASGGDTPEDYDLLLWYAANQVRADWNHFGGLGYFVLLLDAPGRGVVEKRLVREHLGVELQNDVRTEDVWQQLLRKFHGFVVVFSETGRSTDFWRRVTGQGRTILAPAHELFAEIQTGLVYVTDTAKPTEEGLYNFLRAGGQNGGIDRRDATRIWRAYEEARVPFGANTRLGVTMPKPGDVFPSIPDLGKEELSGTTRPSAEPRKPIDWSKF